MKKYKIYYSYIVKGKDTKITTAKDEYEAEESFWNRGMCNEDMKVEIDKIEEIK